jgi:hypothetical protein
MKYMTVLLSFLIIFAVAKPPTSAAAVEITTTVRAALGKIAASAGGALASRLNTQFNDFLALDEQDRIWDGKIQALHYNNTDTLLTLRKQIKLIDADKLSRLEAHVKQARDRYQPLFTLYASLNQQITAAKPLRNKQLNAILRSQADVMRVSVQLARQDIRSKEAALQAAKTNRAVTVKRIKDTLDRIDPLHIRIQAEKSAAASPKKRLSAEWTDFTRTVTKGDAKRANDSLTALIPLARQLVEQKQKQYTLETKIADILRTAKAQLPPQ